MWLDPRGFREHQRDRACARCVRRPHIRDANRPGTDSRTAEFGQFCPDCAYCKNALTFIREFVVEQVRADLLTMEVCPNCSRPESGSGFEVRQSFRVAGTRAIFTR